MARLPDNATLREFQRDLDRHVRERGWQEISVRDTFLLMVEEVGELAKEIRKYTGLHVDRSRSHANNLEHELADILMYVLGLANALEIDLDAAYRSKMREVQERTWSPLPPASSVTPDPR
jgi:NTP pyrophosphatase (non-canonical NTP hydrolase)